MDKRNFILNTILPYCLDPSTRGVSEGRDVCTYLSESGKKCALGKHMREGPWQGFKGGILHLTAKYSLKQVLSEEAYNQKLKGREWAAMQLLHDDMHDNGLIPKRCLTLLKAATAMEFPELEEYVVQN